jgi:pimeloyl-ACP methyl ester carboxylesterase
MNKVLVIICLTLISIQAFSQAVFTKTNCFLPQCDSFKNRKLVFGKLLLNDPPTIESGKPFEMAVVIIKAKNPAPHPDPIIYIQGGPGQKAIYGIEQWLKEPYGNSRDIVLFDPRGVGYSSALVPQLKNDFIDIYKKNLTYQQAVDEFIKLFYEARETLTNENIDITLFHSTQIANDIKQLIDALGYRSVNIYSGSYGTKYAQAFIRDYPEVIRSVVMDSPVPYKLEGTGQAAFWIPSFNRTLSILDSAVSANTQLQKKYGSYSLKFKKILEDFKNKPLQIYLFDGSEFVINDFDLMDVFHFMHYNTNNYTVLPWLLNAAEKRDTLALKSIFENASLMFEVVNMTTYLLTMLNDGHDIKIQEEYNEVENAFPFYKSRLLFNMIEYHLYAKEQSKPSDPFAFLPVQSHVPVLLLSGELDPATPPYFADSIKKYFANAVSIILPFSGHSVTVQNCGAGIMDSFIDAPDKLPQHNCIHSLNQTSSILTSVVYNPRLFYFISALILKPDFKIRVLTILAILPAFLLILIQSIKKITTWKRKSTTSKAKLIQFAYALSVLIFFGVLLYGFNYTGSRYSALLAVGFPGQFNLLFFLPYIVVAFAIAFTFNYFKNKSVIFKRINISLTLILVSLGAFLWLSFLFWW